MHAVLPRQTRHSRTHAEIVVDHVEHQALGKGARRSRATALSERLYRAAEEMGSGAELFVDGPEPQAESKDHERVPETGEALLYVEMSRLMVRRLALS